MVYISKRNGSMLNKLIEFSLHQTANYKHHNLQSG